jgi:arylsulfatase A-like enzyme
VRAARDLRCLALVALALFACTAGSPERARPHLVLVVIDTLRRDHLGSYGYARDTSPFIDELASRGLVFERAVAQAPWTGASMASLWTSRHPSEVGGIVLPDEHGVQELGRTPIARLRRGTPTLAEHLRDAGYRTRAFVANPYAGAALGLLGGFEQVVERPLDARALVDRALAQLRSDLATPGPLFVYLHFRDIHEPVSPPEPYRSQFPGLDGRARGPEHARWRFGDAPDPEAPEVQLFRSHKIALYDGALRFVDDELRRLSQLLEAAGVGPHTLFAIASDHGEAFWEHARFEQRVQLDPRGIGGIGHGHSLFRELLDVPLILVGPGVPRGRVAIPVRNLDLTPTLLGLAGARPLPDMRGNDLVRALAEQRLVPQPAFSENIAYGPEARSLTGERYKLVRYLATREGPNEIWLDRLADPDERPQAHLDDRETERRLRAELDAIEAELASPAAPEPAVLDPEREAALRALGYGQ